EANKLVGAGKKHLVMGKVVEAVNSLQEACGILAKTFGDTADECGEAFFWCGKALLDLARMENSVLGNALEGVPDEDEEDEEKTPKDSIVDSTENMDEKTRDELRDQVYDAMDGAADKTCKCGFVVQDGEDEEVGNLQLAWEMLEVAKVIYKRKEAKDDQLMAAQAHLKLGEVSVESGNYTQALDDFQECLKLQAKLDADSRLLAETHYQLGLTHGLNLQHGAAVAELSRSISVIKSRLDKLQELVDKAEGPEELPEERKEMEELKALLPEIQEKVEDANESLKTAKSVSQNGDASSSFPGPSLQNDDSSKVTNGCVTNGATSGHASTAAVSDISHLVRKKRKPESPKKEGEVKKMKQD
uniref:Tetratricopeptide SHNi-TPR domain-containing protein n=1 Tax=Tetraodon nigroviridis TaxID=99883 RepID=H3CNB5_TETNG